MKVLVVVDVEQCFCNGGSLAVPDGDAVVPVINKLMADGKFDLVVATLDWHPSDHVSFAVNHPGRNVFDLIEVNGVPQVLWPVHGVAGTPGAEFHPDLDVSKVDHVVKKGTSREVDSYSAFFDNNHVKDTGLAAYLNRQAALRGESVADVEVAVTGLATDYCVKFTAIDAAHLGYKTSVLIDAARGVFLNAGDDVKTYRELVEAGVTLAESREYLRGANVTRTPERAVEIVRGLSA